MALATVAAAGDALDAVGVVGAPAGLFLFSSCGHAVVGDLDGCKNAGSNFVLKVQKI